MSVAERREVTSVGIDVGTTTSHLVFSKLILERDPFSKSRKFHVTERQVTYRGRIFFTPLREGNSEIDVDGLLPMLMEEYDRAGIGVGEVDTGAVVITGESTKKENAERIVELLAGESGKFVAATAGPNFESVISAHGSGAVEYSRANSCQLIHCDTGGGTSNIAVIKNGEITATACMNVGGRLIAFDEDSVIVRLEPVADTILEGLGVSLEPGDAISEVVVEKITGAMASALYNVLTGRRLPDFARALMLTPELPPESFEGKSLYSFSGGVAEFIYNKDDKRYGDLGLQLGRHLRGLFTRSNVLVELPERIRATVIGASGYTLQVSGSTTYISPQFTLPLRNLPVVNPNVDRGLMSIEHVHKQITSALKRQDMVEGDAPLALAFHDPVRTEYGRLRTFSLGLLRALPRTVERGLPVILIFDTDIGNSVGNVLFRETGTRNVLSIDEIELTEGDFIDIGEPFEGGDFYPVVIKSLVFSS
ncbi:MAG: ethanolamine ammonia-lyase reactivating factor EutA [Candidatus Bathyarchaeota archaeon]|nr:MAG: ethanolamine ammonia-lyase reactivating factor EutA [Candidatus Bathyarchaeota archaeon]